jgi:hypothetical protein
LDGFCCSDLGYRWGYVGWETDGVDGTSVGGIGAGMDDGAVALAIELVTDCVPLFAMLMKEGCPKAKAGISFQCGLGTPTKPDGGTASGISPRSRA